MQSVGFWEAVGLWWLGSKVDGMALWGVVPVLWVGRFGKVLAFGASIVAVIDIIGSDQISQWAARARRGAVVRLSVNTRLNALAIMSILSLLYSGVFAFPEYVPGGEFGVPYFVTMFVLMIGIIAAGMAAGSVEGVVRRIGRVLENPRWERLVRWSAFSLLIIGFAMDLLAS